MKYFFSSICILISLAAPLSSQIALENLNYVSLNDKFWMREFVKLILTWDAAAHVIYFDNKPACLSSAKIKSTDKLFMDVAWLKGWKAFKKNEHLFPHPNFIFSANISEDEDKWKWINLFIINKKALEKCLQHYESTFQKVLGKKISLDWFLAELDTNKSVLEILKKDEKLLGILLGYGEESADAFQKHQQQESYSSTEYSPIEVKPPLGCTLFPLGMMGNPHSNEVNTLISVYEKEMDIFWDAYSKEDPLILFFRSICRAE